jgi:hypothetical protein
MTTIWVSKGAAEYIGGTVTETTGADITEASFEIGLSSTATPPDTFSTPDDVDNPTPSTATVKLLVDDSTEPGTYTCWVRVTDNPEVLPLRIPGRFHVR